MIHWCWRCEYEYDPDSIMIGDICPNCGISQKPRKNRGKSIIPKEKTHPILQTEKPRFFNVRITAIATDSAREKK